MSNTAGTIITKDNSEVQIGNRTNIYHTNDACLADLRSTDPRDDKKRIEQTKGGLLEDSYCWILKNTNFQQWRNDEQSRLLWIKGDPGKGKTMLLCGIINELKKETGSLLSYFFCQGTDSRVNNATAVLRGLIYLLIDQQPSLISHVRKKYDHAGKGLFEDVNAWWALSEIFTKILQDPNLKNTTFLTIDALDECESDLTKLLDLIVQHSSSARVKWLISSRNKSDIEQKLKVDRPRVRIDLELKQNAECVSQAVDTYIRHSVSQLSSIQDDQGLQDELQEAIRQKANGTFLWVSLVIKELEEVENWEVLQVVGEMPSGLKAVYGRMMKQIQQLKPRYAELCQHLLSTVCTAYRPLSLDELGNLSGLPNEISQKPQSVKMIVTKCGSFLTIRDKNIYIVHQSAKDYLSTEAFQAIFPVGVGKVHYSAFTSSLQIMSETLRRDMFDLRHPGTSIDDVRQPEPSPLAKARYSCIYWVDHLSDAISHKTSIPINDLEDGGTVHRFLSEKYLYWLEALSLLRDIPGGVVAMAKLETLLVSRWDLALYRTEVPINILYQEESDGSLLFSLVRDAQRFILSHGWAIGNAPLQAYVSALIFSPMRSITRRLLAEEEPAWIVAKPAIAEDWNAYLATLEGHVGPVHSVAFSPDGQRLASASYDKTIKIWNATTGRWEATLEGHSSWAHSVAFSPDGQRLASASRDKTIKIWDATTGHYQTMLVGHWGSVGSVAFSPDGQRLASASVHKTIKIRDATTGRCQTILVGHWGWVHSVVFSPDGQRLASASNDTTIKIWDATMGHCVATLEGHDDDDRVTSVAFSPDGQRLVSASIDKTIKIWDTTTGHFQATLKGHDGVVNSVAFSPDGQRLASASYDKTIKIWDVTMGHYEATLKGHSNSVTSVAFSPDGQCLASASYDEIIKIWDTTTGHFQATLKGHDGVVNSVAFSPDGQRLASASYDKTIKIWDVTMGHYEATLKGHSNSVTSVAFSPDGQRLASASQDETVRIWDATTGHCQATLEGHSNSVYSVVFSPDSQRLASASHDETIKIWNATTGHCQATLVVGEIVVITQFDVVGARLLTHRGTFNLTQLSLSSSPTTPMPTSAPLHHSPQYQGYGISADRVWVTYAGRNLLWLPSEYRPVTSAIAASTVALGCSSGRVLLFRFSGDGPG